MVKLIYTTKKQGFNYSTIVDDVSDDFEGVPYFGKRLKNENHTEYLISSIPILFPGLLAGITIGIVF